MSGTILQQIHALQKRVEKPEKLSHSPVAFVEDVNGFLHIAKSPKSNEEKTDG